MVVNSALGSRVQTAKWGIERSSGPVRRRYVTRSSFDLVWLKERGRCCLWGYGGFTSLLCKNHTYEYVPSWNHVNTQMHTHRRLRAGARQRQTMESYSPWKRHAPTANRHGTQTDEDSGAFVMSWMKVCECLRAPTPTDSDVRPFSPSVSPFLRPTLESRKGTMGRMWADAGLKTKTKAKNKKIKTSNEQKRSHSAPK